MQPAEYQSVYIDNGNEVAVHGRKHFSLTAITAARIIEEIFTDRKAHESALGQIVTGMAYANGKLKIPAGQTVEIK